MSDDGDNAGLDLTDEPAGPDTATPAADDSGAAVGTASNGAATPAATADNATQTGAGEQAGTSATQQSTTTAGGAAAAAASRLTAGGTPILPVPTAGLDDLAGKPVVGTAVTVESVVADEGFWVGSSPTDRVFVFLTPQARTTTGESPFQVKAGQAINLQGTLTALSGAPGALGVDADEGAKQLTQQGHLIEATEISLS